MAKKTILALVTARGGSKGFPRKNIALLAGRPLVCWAHRALDGFRDIIRAHYPEYEVILRLSTDSEEIAEAWPLADRPAKNDLRDPSLSQDGSSSMDVVRAELERLEKLGKSCDVLILLQPTSPLLNADDVFKTWESVAESEWGPSSIAVTRPAHPLAWAKERDESNPFLLHSTKIDGDNQQRQKQKTYWMPVGLYAATREFFELYGFKDFYVPNVSTSIEVPSDRATDIDYKSDLAVAQVLKHRRSGEHPFRLGEREVGGNAKCFVIAEAGVNHNGDPEKAFALVQAAYDAGAHAVKFQTFRAKELVGSAARKAAYQVVNTGGSESQLAMLERLELGPEVFRALKAKADELGLVFLSTPFDRESAKLLNDLGVVGFKLGSGDLTNLPFLEEIAEFGKPIILSSGMATLDEVEDAIAALHKKKCFDVAMLHCVSSYPAPIDQTNLLAMDSIRLAVGGPVGMSDHSMGWEVTLAAVARGAKVIEKHLTLDRTLPGPDHAASIEPQEFAQMMRQIRLVESALGDGIKRPAPCERDTAEVARRSVVAARDLAVGTRLTAADLAIKRPGTGIEPRHHTTLAGRTLRRAVNIDEPLHWEDLA